MRLSSPVSKKKARIEIIPLIDIVFFLLATFALVSLSMVKNQGISVHLPKAVSGSSQELSHVATLSIKASGALYLDKRPVTKDELPLALSQLKNQYPELKILINGDSQTSFGSAVAVLDEVRRLGITKVSIRTQK